MKKLILRYSATLLCLTGLQSVAAADPMTADTLQVDDPCFLETLKIQDADRTPSTAPCQRALRNREYESREDRSIKLYNLGIIQASLGDREAAMSNLEASVALTQKVDQRQIALAQLAHESGDHVTAMTQYSLLLNSPAAEISQAARQVIKRNVDRLNTIMASRSGTQEMVN